LSGHNVLGETGIPLLDLSATPKEDLSTVIAAEH